MEVCRSRLLDCPALRTVRKPRKRLADIIERVPVVMAANAFGTVLRVDYAPFAVKVLPVLFKPMADVVCGRRASTSESRVAGQAPRNFETDLGQAQAANLLSLSQA